MIDMKMFSTLVPEANLVACHSTPWFRTNMDGKKLSKMLPRLDRAPCLTPTKQLDDAQ
jgi:hypothetical protein